MVHLVHLSLCCGCAEGSNYVCFLFWVLWSAQRVTSPLNTGVDLKLHKLLYFLPRQKNKVYSTGAESSEWMVCPRMSL